jgi:hypothetical protein
LEVIGHLPFPERKAAFAVERHEVCVGGGKEESSTEYGYTAVYFGRIIGIDDLSAALILPDGAASASVKREHSA